MRNQPATRSERRCLMMVSSLSLPVVFFSINRANGQQTEFKHIHRALCDPYDQSLWFYHQNLMCTFDPALSGMTMAPSLSTAERLGYVQREIEELQEMLDGAEDCKYIYQTLIECTLLASRIQGTGTLPSAEKKQILNWLSELKRLDPLRQGRWLDFEKSLDSRTEAS